MAETSGTDRERPVVCPTCGETYRVEHIQIGVLMDTAVQSYLRVDRPTGGHRWTATCSCATVTAPSKGELERLLEPSTI